jgi:glucan phosphoethanolaminetransferase (alkaline phosphatase superfamily)
VINSDGPNPHPAAMLQTVIVRQRLRFLLGTSLVLTMVLNWSLFCLSFPDASRQAASMGTMLLAVVLVWTQIFLVIALLSMRRRLFQAAVAILVVGFGIPDYFIGMAKISINLVLIALYQTNPYEAAGMISTALIYRIVALLILAAAVIWLSNCWRALSWHQLRTEVLFTAPFGLMLATTAAAFAISPRLAAESVVSYLPIGGITQARTTLLNAARIGDRSKNRIDLGRLAATIAADQSDGLIVVVVVGETARAKSFHLNGYPRNTNPQLGRVDGLINFTDAWACQTLTIKALPCLMTRSTVANLEQTLGTESSFISVFKRAGFHTAWLSTEPDWTITNANYLVLTALFREADQTHFARFINKFNKNRLRRGGDFSAHLLLPRLDALLEQGTGGPLLVVLNTFGSHFPYVREYLADGPFQPVCDGTAECDNLQHVINAYDNTIFHTDQFLGQIIQRLQHRRALFLYVSDHGESLGEDGYFLHGHGFEDFAEIVRNDKYVAERHIPMLWWASQSFLADPTAAQRFQHLAAKREDRVSHDNIFHSVIDCAGIESSAVYPELSLCSPDPVPDYMTAFRR